MAAMPLFHTAIKVNAHKAMQHWPSVPDL